MKLCENDLYKKSIEKTAKAFAFWDRLSGKCILAAGATGLIGRYLIDLIMYENFAEGLNCTVTAVSRNAAAAGELFSRQYWETGCFQYIAHDISQPLQKDLPECLDYVLNLASNTHPLAYAKRPVETITANVYGTKNLLDLCADKKNVRFVLPSSVEIYGENRGHSELFREEDMGYLDPNTLRAGYPESKRVCESLCQAYLQEKGVDVVIVRLPRIFGPTMGADDSKAAAQFIKKAVNGENIVLKSDGSQYYSFLYVPDAVTGLLTAMLLGKHGDAYNLASADCDKRLKEMAVLCAANGNGRVVCEYPDDVESRGYSTATLARLDGTKAQALGWSPVFSIEEGLDQTIHILRETGKQEGFGM